MDIERTTLRTRAAIHAALADVVRLAVVDQLALGDRSPSELQTLLDLPSNLMAHHLKVLEDAGLVARRRSEGDRRRTYLTVTESGAAESSVDKTTAIDRVVFVCSANSARSQLAAALWTNASDVPATSAGTHPAEDISEGAKAVAHRRSLKLVAAKPQPFTEVADRKDFVVAVCDNAYEELGSKVALHWSIPDPVAKGGIKAFDLAYAELDRRITALAPHLVASTSDHGVAYRDHPQ